MQQGKQTKRLPGFYIALCCCVAVIGIAGFFAQNYNETSTVETSGAALATNEPYDIASIYTYKPSDDESASVSSSETIVIEEETEAPSEESAAAPDSSSVSDAQETAAEYTIDNPDLMSASAIIESAKADENAAPPVLSDPVPNMNVLYGFSGDTLMYNDALGDWRTHDGIDIEADLGSSVAAAAEGTVTEVTTGSRGGRVVIDHSGGLQTVYEQLTDVCVSEGDTVTQAEVIGMIAESVGESTRQAHLHYEVLKDGAAVDPLAY